MPRTRRGHTLLWLLVAQAMLSLCGPGHHALDEWFGPTSDACRLDSSDHGPQVSESVDSCPVCDYLAQTIVPPDRPSASIEPVVEVAAVVAESASPSGPSLTFSRPRAPPLRLV